MYSLGSNENGQLGVLTKILNKDNYPIEITFLRDKKITSVHCGYDFSFALSGKLKYFLKFLENNVYVFGSNCYGQLGLEYNLFGKIFKDINAQKIPTELKFFRGMKIKNVYLGYDNSFVVTGMF